MVMIIYATGGGASRRGVTLYSHILQMLSRLESLAPLALTKQVGYKVLSLRCIL